MGRGGAHVDLGPARARVAKGKQSKKARANAKRHAQIAREVAAAAVTAAKRTAALRLWAAEERRLSAKRRSLPRTAQVPRRVKFAPTLQVTEIPVSHSNLLPDAIYSPARLRDGPPDSHSPLQSPAVVPFNDATFSDEDDDDDEYAPIPERLAADDGGEDLPTRRILRSRRSRAASSTVVADAPPADATGSSQEPTTPPATRQSIENFGKPSKCANKAPGTTSNEPRKIVPGVYTPPPRPRRGVLKRVGTDLARKNVSLATVNVPHGVIENEKTVTSPEVIESPSSSPNSRSSLTKREKLIRRVRRLSADVMVIGGSPSKGGEKRKHDEMNSASVATGSNANPPASGAEITSDHCNSHAKPNGQAHADEAKENGKKSKKDRKRKRTSQDSPEVKQDAKRALSINGKDSHSPKTSPRHGKKLGKIENPELQDTKKKNRLVAPPKVNVDGVEELEDLFSGLKKSKAKQREAVAAAKSVDASKQKVKNGVPASMLKKKLNGPRFTEEGLRVYTYDEIAEDQPSGLNGPCPFECSCCY